MGNTKRTARIVMAAFIAVTAGSLTACGSGPSTQVEELGKRGFTDIVVEVENSAVGTYYAYAGGCRVVLDWYKNRDPGTQWLLIERSSAGEEQDIILPNPTATKVGQMPEFEYCYETEASTPPAEDEQ